MSPSGKAMYWFHSAYKPSSDYSSRHPFAVDGVTLDFDPFNPSELVTLPEEAKNPEKLRDVYASWIQDCSGAFVKPPTIEQCLANTEVIWDSNVSTTVTSHLLNIEGYKPNQLWTILWLPTKIKVDSPKFQVYWAAVTKVPAPPRNEKISMEDDTTIHEVEVQYPEKTYTIHPGGTRTFNGEWIQDITDIPLSMSDAPPLRLDVDIDAQREKMRRKVRDARLRAKLAKYRAERMARRYEERFGIYPDEDEEEAQTEVETDATE